MTTVKIEIPEQQAAVLSAKAAEQGLTLERWFQKVAEQEAERSAVQAPRRTTEQHGSVVEEIRKLRARIQPDPEGWTTRDYVNFGRR
ncbi:MAG: hypothetical protein KJZ78_21180 [Bryobacteraceae bacterium]|nr:hypothetical protein [Bryobacteraceae bacterium]